MAGKNAKILQEVLDEIEASLKDNRGIVSHQRRLAFSLSLGAVTLLEEYLNKKEVLKSGANINHLWMKKKKETIKELISNQIILPIENLINLDKLLDLASQIEKERNQLAYGREVSDLILREKIKLFFDLKKEVEDA